ncbi:MAG TPA: DUF222 domain-containing protein, partial [Candidatus Nanopelagicales bacterium]|nr:DUF222 domain-containing protein [Candidatus Nanopelagicales bacterium]
MSASPFAPPAGGDDEEWFVPFTDAELEAGFAAAEYAELGGDPSAPQSFDDPDFRDEDLLAMRGPVCGVDLMLLESLDPTSLDRAGRLDYLRRAEAVEAFAASLKVRATVACAGVDGSDSTRDRYVAMEVAQLRRVGEGAAASGIATARGLHVQFPEFLAALAAGEVSEWHCRVLISGTVNVTDREVLARLQDRLLPKAKRRTP